MRKRRFMYKILREMFYFGFIEPYQEHRQHKHQMKVMKRQAELDLMWYGTLLKINDKHHSRTRSHTTYKDLFDILI